MENLQQNVWKWRDGELSMKEFYKLNKQDKEQYLEVVKSLPKELRSSIDDYLINLYNLDKHTSKNFISL